MLNHIRSFGFNDFPRRTQTSGGSGSLQMNAADYARGIIIRLRKATTIKKIYLDCSLVGSAMTNPIDVRIETINTGVAWPTGTLWSTGTNDSSQTITTTGLKEFTLTNAATIGVNDIFGIVIRSPSTGFGDITWRAHHSGQFFANNGIYYGLNSGAGWAFTGTFTSSSGNMMIGIEDESGEAVFLPTHLPLFGAISGTNISSDTSPDELGNRFYVPYDCYLSGINAMADLDAGNLFKIYDDSNNVLTTYTVADYLRGASTGGNLSYILPVEVLLKRGWHRITLAPTTTGTNAIIIGTFMNQKFATLITRDLYYKTSRTNAGAWTDETDKICYISPEFGYIAQGGGINGFAVR